MLVFITLLKNEGCDNIYSVLLLYLTKLRKCLLAVYKPWNWRSWTNLNTLGIYSLVPFLIGKLYASYLTLVQCYCVLWENIFFHHRIIHGQCYISLMPLLHLLYERFGRCFRRFVCYVTFRLLWLQIMFPRYRLMQSRSRIKSNVVANIKKLHSSTF